MISDIVKAIELLVDILRSGKSPEAKRSKFGKTLLQIYQQLAIVIDRGNKILSSIENEQVGLYVVTVNLLEEQYRALQDLTDGLNEMHINAILHLHLPDLKEVNALLDMKVDTNHWC